MRILAAGRVFLSEMPVTTGPQVVLIDGFDDAASQPEVWNDLLAESATRTVFLTRGWLQAWWKTFGTGELLLVAAEHHGRIRAVASLFADRRIVRFVGPGEAGYLDFLGDIADPRPQE